MEPSGEPAPAHLELKIEEPEPNVKLLRLFGDVDLHTCGQLEEALGKLLSRTPKALLLELSRSFYMSSAGIGLLMTCHVSLTKRRSRLCVIAPSEELSRTLELVGFFEIVETAPSVEAALQKLRDEEDEYEEKPGAGSGP